MNIFNSSTNVSHSRKNILNFTMSQMKLALKYDPETMKPMHLVLLHTHHQCTDNLNLLKVMQDLVSRNPQRQDFFGNFQTQSHWA